MIAVDLRGFGWTDIAWTGFEKEAMADDIANLLAELELERVTHVGHDWGACPRLPARDAPAGADRAARCDVVAAALGPSRLRSLRAAPRLSIPAHARLSHGGEDASNPRYVAHTVKAWSKQRGNLPAEVRKLYGRKTQGLHAGARHDAALPPVRHAGASRRCWRAAIAASGSRPRP